MCVLDASQVRHSAGDPKPCGEISKNKRNPQKISSSILLLSSGLNSHIFLGLWFCFYEPDRVLSQESGVNSLATVGPPAVRTDAEHRHTHLVFMRGNVSNCTCPTVSHFESLNKQDTANVSVFFRPCCVSFL